MHAVADDDDAVVGDAPAVAAAENRGPLAGLDEAAARRRATVGVLPRPPIARLPTLITGRQDVLATDRPDGRTQANDDLDA